MKPFPVSVLLLGLLMATPLHPQERAATGQYDATVTTDQVNLKVLKAIADEAHASFNRSCTLDGHTWVHGTDYTSNRTCQAPLTATRPQPLVYTCISGKVILRSSGCV